MPEYLFIEGFDYYPSNTTAAGVGVASTWIQNGNGGHELLDGRFLPGKAFRFSGNGGNGSARLPFEPSQMLVIGFACRLDADFGNFASGVGSRFSYLADNLGGIQIQLHTDQVGNLNICRADQALIKQCSRRLIKNTWHYLEFAIDVGNSGSIQVWIDGEDQGLTNGDTQSTSVQNMAQIGFTYQFNNWNSAVVDDMYGLKDTLTPLGESRIQLLEPTSDAAVAWTPSAGSNNYGNVDEASSDGDTTYNSTNTVGARDLFGFSDITVNPSVIHAIALITAARKEDSATRTIRTVVKSNASIEEGVDYNLTTDYTWMRSILPLDPDGDVAWNKTAVNSVQIGYELVL